MIKYYNNNNIIKNLNSISWSVYLIFMNWTNVSKAEKVEMVNILKTITYFYKLTHTTYSVLTQIPSVHLFTHIITQTQGNHTQYGW